VLLGRLLCAFGDELTMKISFLRTRRNDLEGLWEEISSQFLTSPSTIKVQD
jgi:hypothetical protein